MQVNLTQQRKIKTAIKYSTKNHDATTTAATNTTKKQ